MVRSLEDYELLLRGHQRGHQNNWEWSKRTKGWISCHAIGFSGC